MYVSDAMDMSEISGHSRDWIRGVICSHKFRGGGQVDAPLQETDLFSVLSDFNQAASASYFRFLTPSLFRPLNFFLLHYIVSWAFH